VVQAEAHLAVTLLLIKVWMVLVMVTHPDQVEVAQVQQRTQVVQVVHMALQEAHIQVPVKVMVLHHAVAVVEPELLVVMELQTRQVVMEV
jgi:hypothetical protein